MAAESYERRRPDLGLLWNERLPRTVPATRYARSGNVSIAYQVVGEGAIDLVLVPGWVSHVEYGWEVPSYAAFLRRLARFSRLIILDRRGTGLSDRVAGLPTLEERMDDVRAVMDDAGSERAVLVGLSEGGPMCSLFAAAYPDRTQALVLYGTLARVMYAPDYPLGVATKEIEALLAVIERDWGRGITAVLFAPSAAGDPGLLDQWARFERYAVSPGGMRKLVEMLADTDVRTVLPSIRVPTLVLHRREDPVTLVEGGRHLAKHIPGARYVELRGVDHFPWIGDSEAILSEIEEFVTGERGTHDTDRVLATVYFTDIVDSTRRAAALGDAHWGHDLRRFYEAVGGALRTYRGVEIDRTGDGVFARFEGPARAIRCAMAIRDGVARLGLSVRSGVHTGECEVLGDRLAGIAVHLGARIAAAAQPDEVLVSSTVRDLVAGSGLRFVDRGERSLKGVPEVWRLYAVEA